MLEVTALLLDSTAPDADMAIVLSGLSAALDAEGCILTEGVPQVWQRIAAGFPDLAARLPIGDLNRGSPRRIR